MKRATAAFLLVFALSCKRAEEKGSVLLVTTQALEQTGKAMLHNRFAFDDFVLAGPARDPASSTRRAIPRPCSAARGGSAAR